MRSFFANAGALALGGLSLGLTVVLLLGLQRLLGVDFFSLMWCAVVPVGAFGAGLLAASGYFLGAVKLGVRPTRVTAAGLLLLAIVVQVTLYYAQYAMALTESGEPISDFVGFPRFVGWMLSHARYGVIVSGYRPGGEGGGLEVGAIGYLVALAQFLALVAAGLATYVTLAAKPYCTKCSRYLRPARKVQVPFKGELSALADLRASMEPSEAYFERLRALPPGVDGVLEVELLRCPSCEDEALIERPMLVKSGKLTYQGDAYRTLRVPTGHSVEPQLAQFGVLGAAGTNLE